MLAGWAAFKVSSPARGSRDIIIRKRMKRNLVPDRCQAVIMRWYYFWQPNKLTPALLRSTIATRLPVHYFWMHIIRVWRMILAGGVLVARSSYSHEKFHAKRFRRRVVFLLFSFHVRSIRLQVSFLCFPFWNVLTHAFWPTYVRTYG